MSGSQIACLAYPGNKIGSVRLCFSLGSCQYWRKNTSTEKSYKIKRIKNSITLFLFSLFFYGAKIASYI